MRSRGGPDHSGGQSRHSPRRQFPADPRERVACAYEVHDPLLVLRYTGEITPEEAAIGGYVSELIHDGDCVQFGLGGTPSAVAAALTDQA